VASFALIPVKVWNSCTIIASKRFVLLFNAAAPHFVAVQALSFEYFREENPNTSWRFKRSKPYQQHRHGG
jgi:hypothetical protein